MRRPLLEAYLPHQGVATLLPLYGWADAYQSIVIQEFGGPEELQLVSHSSLPEPGLGEVRLRVLTASASFTDVMVRKGQYTANTLPDINNIQVIGK